jgi:anaerobic magnesium-protoporphyrin IX monomethyl ester cyclase
MGKTMETDRRDVVLVNPLVESRGHGDHVLKESVHTPPEGLCYLAACLRMKGVRVAIVDAVSQGLNALAAARAVLAYEPRIVGLGLMTISANAAGRIADAIKAVRSECAVVAGGPHVTIMSEETLKRFASIDFAVIGEGETTMTELTLALLNGKNGLDDIAGIAFRREAGIVRTKARPFIEDLDSLPLPAWDLLPDLVSTYKQSVARSHTAASIGMVTSRGCNGKCNFCARPVHGNRLRAFSAGRVLEMFDVLCRDHGIRGFVINDDTFVVFKKRLRDICNELAGRPTRPLWSCFARVDQVDRETLTLMYAAGCRTVSFGIESGSQRMLDAMNKEITIAQSEKAVREAHRAGLFINGYFVIGFPGETAESIDETMRFAESLPLDNAFYAYATPHPGTKFYDMIRSARDIDWDRFDQWQLTYVPDGMTEEELSDRIARATKSFYMRPGIWFRHARRALKERRLLPYIREGSKFVAHMFAGSLSGEERRP